MIISHDYKFIFIKTNKTASTSVEMGLSKVCGANDIITPISPEDEKTRCILGYRGPQKYLAPISDYRVQDWIKLLKTGIKKKRFYNHIPAKEIKHFIGPSIWHNYFKFCFERNPWDRVISLYWWRFKSEPRPAFSKFLESDTLMALKKKGFNLYTINGKVVVDKIFRFENLYEEVELIRKQLNIKEKIELPHAKSTFRKNMKSYRNFFNKAERIKIEEIFKDEISLMGYRF